MIIRKIRMVNFRGFHDKTIDFKEKPVVLLSAANGMGKTTTIDAIEWCLTGQIKRLQTAFDSRSTNDTERKLNTDGILKNKDADSRSKVKVFLWLYDGDKETVLYREQKKDELNSELSTVTIEEDEERAKAFIGDFVGKSFYNFHFCDIHKAFNIQSTKRKNLQDFFNEFITNYDEQKQIADNLDIFASDVDRYIQDKKNQKYSQDLITEREKQLEDERKRAKQVKYPDIFFYPDEIIDIEILNEDELNAQKNKVEECGYQVAAESLFKLIQNDLLKNQETILQEICSYWQKMTVSIQCAIKYGFAKNTDKITTLKAKKIKLKELELSKDTIWGDAEYIVSLGKKDFLQVELDDDRAIIDAKEKRVKALSDEIDLLSKNNKMLKLLSGLTAKKKVFIDYRDVARKNKDIILCPVCGSDSFNGLDKDSILKEADEYIRQNGAAVKVKEEERTVLQEEIETLYQAIFTRAERVVEEERILVEKEIQELEKLYNETRSYFEQVAKLKKIRKGIEVETLTEAEVAKMIIEVQIQLLSQNQEQELRTEYEKILTILGYQFQQETLQQTEAKIKNKITRSDKVLNFSYDIFVSKINAIDSILANHTLDDLRKGIMAYYKKNQELDAEIDQLNILRETAKQRAKEIRDLIEELTKDELEKIGPTLTKFYNKLSRFNSEDGIRLVPENNGISLVDDNGKNIVNVLSNGQISVFMLAYFFAGINARNEREKLKVYFIDDLTACMDDVNMLTFMDLLKYQISSKATMEQLFFVTCDDRIGNLLKYKLDGRGIEFRELLEADFA